MQIPQTFIELHYEVNDLLRSLSLSYDPYKKSKKLQLSDAIFCAEDLKRNYYFYSATQNRIEELRSQGNHCRVMDAGAWSWILGLFALLLWAEHCTFAEYNPDSMDLCRKLIQHYNFGDKSSFVEGDILDMHFEERFDLIISETIMSWFWTEDYPFIVWHLQKYLSPLGHFMPHCADILLKFIGADQQVLKTASYHLNSKDPVHKIKMVCPTKAKYITLATTLYFDDVIQASSWDFGQFLNVATIWVNEPHNLFNFVLESE